MKVTWGLTGNSHDASLAVWIDDSHYGDNGLRYAALTGSADHSREFFESARRRYGDPDEIVWYERPRLKTLRQLWAGQGWLWKENNIRQYLEDRKASRKKFTGQPIPIRYVQHHLSHAAYAYYTQLHDDCAVICLDSIGEFETLTIWHGRNGKLKKLHSQGYPHSLGLFYSAMTQRLGLTPQRDEYLVAEWAKKGDANRFIGLLHKEIISFDPKSELPAYILMRENLHRGCLWWRPEIQSQQDLYDLAAATQKSFCHVVKFLGRWAKANTRSNHIAFAGGGAMNNEAVTAAGQYYNSVWVPPKPGDPGSAIGCILARKRKFITNVDSVWQ